jgi:hypothetical protein
MGQRRTGRPTLRLKIVEGSAYFCAAALLGMAAVASAQPVGTPVPPPPPGPGGCRGPACGPNVPRDELVTSLPAASAHQNPSGSFDTPLIDISNLSVQPAEIDVGVTSGADPSSWDNFNVATANRYEACVSETHAGSSGDQPVSSACTNAAKQEPQPPAH